MSVVAESGEEEGPGGGQGKGGIVHRLLFSTFRPRPDAPLCTLIATYQDAFQPEQHPARPQGIADEVKHTCQHDDQVGYLKRSHAPTATPAFLIPSSAPVQPFVSYPERRVSRPLRAPGRTVGARAGCGIGLSNPASAGGVSVPNIRVSACRCSGIRKGGRERVVFAAVKCFVLSGFSPLYGEGGQGEGRHKTVGSTSRCDTFCASSLCYHLGKHVKAGRWAGKAWQEHGARAVTE